MLSSTVHRSEEAPLPAHWQSLIAADAALWPCRQCHADWSLCQHRHCHPCRACRPPHHILQVAEDRRPRHHSESPAAGCILPVCCRAPLRASSLPVACTGSALPDCCALCPCCISKVPTKLVGLSRFTFSAPQQVPAADPSSAASIRAAGLCCHGGHLDDPEVLPLTPAKAGRGLWRCCTSRGSRQPFAGSVAPAHQGNPRGWCCLPPAQAATNSNSQTLLFSYRYSNLLNCFGHSLLPSVYPSDILERAKLACHKGPHCSSCCPFWSSHPLVSIATRDVPPAAYHLLHERAP